MGDYFRELICVRKPGKVVRRRGLSSRSCTALGRSGFQKQGRYEGVNEGLQVWIDPRAFGTPCILLKFCYRASKRGCFAFSRRGNRIQDGDKNLETFEENERAKEKKIIIKVKFF